MMCVGYCCFLVCDVFFFFKQKTAYEMRISDWSSDVCFSDLRHGRRRPGLRQRVLQVRHALVRVAVEHVADRDGRHEAVVIAAAERLVEEEIGRASCRERVCQYV